MTLDIDLGRLRTLFRGLVVALPLASAPSWLTSCGCPDDTDSVYFLRNPDTQTQALIDACNDPARKDCVPLCEKVTGEHGVADGGSPFTHCELHAMQEGYYEVHVREKVLCIGGRLTEGIALGAGAARGAATFWADMAQMEAASVLAFARLRRELAAHGAPTPLQAAARRAIDEERRHARVVARLARRFGARPGTPAPAELGVRDLEAIAVENAAEGCAREVYGALVATHQAACAADAVVRRAMAGIAVDETRHAALSFALDRWAASRLPAPARLRVRDARRTAAASLLREAEPAVPAPALRLAGLPEPAAARRLASAVVALAEARA